MGGEFLALSYVPYRRQKQNFFWFWVLKPKAWWRVERLAGFQCVFFLFLRVLMETYWKALQHSREVDRGSEGNRKQEVYPDVNFLFLKVPARSLQVNKHQKFYATSGNYGLCRLLSFPSRSLARLLRWKPFCIVNRYLRVTGVSPLNPNISPEWGCEGWPILLGSRGSRPR